MLSYKSQLHEDTYDLDLSLSQSIISYLKGVYLVVLSSKLCLQVGHCVALDKSPCLMRRQPSIP